jgi:hypothetical protein
MKPGIRFAPFAVTVFAGSLHAQSTWNGTTSNNWGITTNWNPASVPGPGADIIINNTTGSSNVLVLDANRAIGNFQFGTTGTRNTSFTVRSTSAHTLDLAGGLNASGPLNAVRLTLNGKFSLSADQIWNIGGSIGSHSSDQGVFIREIVEANGTTPAGAAAIGSFAMDGNLTKTGSGQLVLAATTVSGAGDFIINEGALKLNAGANRLLTVGGSGNITLNNEAQLFLSRNSGTMEVTRDIVLNGSAGMVWGGGGTANDTIVASNIAWNGWSHNINLPTANRYESTGSWTSSSANDVFRTGTGTFTASGDLSGFIGTLNLQGGITNLSGAGTFGGDLVAFAGTNTVAGNIAWNVILYGGTTTLNGSSVGGIFSLDDGAIVTGEILSNGSMHLNGGQFSADPLTAGSLGTLSGLILTGINTVALSATPASSAPFTVLTYGGTLNGGAANLSLLGSASYRSPTFDDSTAGIITLAVGSESRTWAGGASWDINTSSNWQEGDLRYFQVDNVSFTDTGAGSVALVGDLAPASVTIHNSAGNDYTFTAAAGTNRISGSTGIVKSGAGNLTLGGANT